MFYVYNGIAQLLLRLGLAELRSVEGTDQQYAAFGSTWSFALYLVLIVLFCVVIPYLLCSVAVPRTYCRLIHKLPDSKRIEIGDVWRYVGKRHAVSVTAIKVIVCYVCIQIGGLALSSEGAAIAAFFCVLGCAMPIWHKTRGSRGFEAAAICTLILSPLVFGVLLLIYLIVLIGMRYATAARIFPTLLYPLIASAFMMDTNPTMVLLSVVIVALMFFTHWPNIKAMLNREEPRLTFGKRKSEDA